MIDPVAPDLDPARIRTELARHIPGFHAEIVVRATTASTNDDAKAAAAAGAPALSVFIAGAQSAGRGRGGRAWHSPPGENLYLSFLLRPAWDPAAAAPFALVVGLAVAAAIDARLDRPRARVKWPNDVLCDGRKVAGILLEASVRDGRLVSLVVGVGVDVHAASFPPELASIATSLALLGASDRDRGSLAAAIVARVAASAEVFGREGLAPFLAEVRERDALVGRQVRIDGEPGLVRGLDDGGRLLVEREDGAIDAVLAGHVELG